ncbi:MAG: phosphodiester glycosidase family protein [Cyanobacteria bacterium J06639_1]
MAKFLKLALFLLLGGIAAIALTYGIAASRRPPRTNLSRSLFAGVDYHRVFRTDPRPFMLHVVAIDLQRTGVEPFVTPGEPPPAPHDREFFARTTTTALQNHSLQLAINGSFFYPFHAHHPLDFYPHSGDPVGALGQVMSDGTPYSPPQANWQVLCFADVASIAAERCPQGTRQAVAGFEILRAGEPVAVSDASHDRLYPRTAVGISDDGTRLWLAIVDGRQPFYSRGVTLLELSEVLRALGAQSALNLDGGGSTTLATEMDGRAEILNAPIHTRVPMRQRPVANQLGFYALPLEEPGRSPALP